MFIFGVCSTHWRVMTDLRSRNLKKRQKGFIIFLLKRYHPNRIGNKTELSTTHLLCYKSDAIMICHFISLTKNRIKWLPGPLKRIIDGYEP